jgi:hypothetical protein
MHRQIDLPDSALEPVAESLFASASAKPMSVKLSEQLLTEIGYVVE